MVEYDFQFKTHVSSSIDAYLDKKKF